jgi:hypothetical protein
MRGPVLWISARLEILECARRSLSVLSRTFGVVRDRLDVGRHARHFTATTLGLNRSLRCAHHADVVRWLEEGCVHGSLQLLIGCGCAVSRRRNVARHYVRNKLATG